MNAGTAKINITPQKSIPLAGFGFREGGFEGINNPIYIRILFLQSNEDLLYISGDIIWWDSGRVKNFKDYIHRRWGVSRDCMFFCATHSHSGPQTSSEFPRLGQTNDEYLSWMDEQLFMGIDQAIAESEPVDVEQGQTECNVGVFRRKNVNGHIEMAPNYEVDIDQEVMVLHFKTKQQKTKAVIVNYTCHPTTTGDNKISSEYTGIAMESIEAEMGEDAVSLFLQGCCGDIRPNLVKDGQFYKGNPQDVHRLGTELSNAVLSVLKQPMNDLKHESFHTQTVHIDLPLQKLPTIHQLEESLQSENRSIATWAELMLSEPQRMTITRKLEITKIALFHQYTMVTMNAEMVSEYGNFIKSFAQAGRSFMPIGYCNGMIGYVPTSLQLTEGGYESIDSIYPFAIPAPFTDEVEGIIKGKISELLR